MVSKSDFFHVKVFPLMRYEFIFNGLEYKIITKSFLLIKTLCPLVSPCLEINIPSQIYLVDSITKIRLSFLKDL